MEVPATLRPEFDRVLAGTDRRGRFVLVDERRIRYRFQPVVRRSVRLANGGTTIRPVINSP